MYPQQQYGQVQELPFSPDHIQHPFLQGIGPAAAPYVPQLMGVAPALFPYIPTVAGWAAAEIQNVAESNHLRRFFFNMFSQNNFANEDFAALVQSIMDYLEVQLASNPGLRPDNILEKTILQTVEMLVSHMTRVFPRLNAYLTPHQQHNVAAQCTALDQLRGAIQQLRQGGMVFQPQQQVGYVQQAGMVRADPRLAGGGLGMNLNQPSVSISNNLFPGQVVTTANPQGRSMSSDRWSTNLPDLSTPRATGTVANQPTQETSSSVKLAPSSMPQQYTNQNQESTTVNTPEQDGQLEEISTTSLQWTRSETQPYFPAWNPTQQKLFLQRLAGGVVIVRLKKRQEGEMDYERHKTASAFGPIIPKLDLSNTQKTLQAVQAGLDEIRQEKRDREDLVEPNFTTRVNQTLVGDVSHEMLWLKVACNWLQAAENGKRPDIYRQYGTVVELVVGGENEENFIESFRDAGTFAMLFQMLNEAYGVCSSTLWHRVNDRITELVNRVLSFNLSLTGTSIDSFALDGLEILEYLKKEYGEVVYGAFVRNQGYLIRSIFEKVSDELRGSIDGMFLTAPEDGATGGGIGIDPVFTHLVSNASFTFLNCLSHELSLEFNPGEPAILTETLTPVLFNLARNILEESKTAVESTVARHFIQTLDGRIMEADFGFIGEETILIRVVK